MKLLFALVIALIIIVFAQNSIRKHPVCWYCLAFLISVASLILPETAPEWLSDILTDYISRGTLATALFILVMYARILPAQSRISHILMHLRASLAIMAAIMILSHNITCFVQYHKHARLGNFVMTPPEIIAAGCTVFMILLLIPLTFTSFSFIRRKMRGTTWKKVQRLSYLFYALIYLHVACLFGLQITRGNRHYLGELAIYTAVFGFYLVTRIALSIRKHKEMAPGL